MKLMNLFEHWISRNQTRETRETLVNTVSMMMTHGGADLLEQPEWHQTTSKFIDAMAQSRKRVLSPTGRLNVKLADSYRHFGLFPLKLSIENWSFEDWNLPTQNPVTVRYRLNAANGDVKIKASQHKRLADMVPKRQLREFDITLDIDPDVATPGDLLTVTLYQHGTGWFDHHGLHTTELKLPV